VLVDREIKRFMVNFCILGRIEMKTIVQPVGYVILRQSDALWMVRTDLVKPFGYLPDTKDNTDAADIKMTRDGDFHQT
jgi:hypothetical protein